MLHDREIYDYPSYNGSYERSNATVRAYLEKYPSIKVVLDVHRDAIEYDGKRVKAVAEVEGRQAAQVMIICGADKNGNLPNFKKNLGFAAAWENAMESRYPGLTRPVLFDYRYYNQDLTTGSLLIEMGSHGNTLAEAQIENLVTAKGYGDCVAFLSDNGISVVVSASENGLTDTDTARISEIVMGETGLKASQIKIIEAEG